MTEELKQKRKAAVQKTLANRDRVDLVLPKGTKDRIAALGFDNPTKFCRTCVLAEIEKMELMRRR